MPFLMILYTYHSAYEAESEGVQGAIAKPPARARRRGILAAVKHIS